VRELGRSGAKGYGSIALEDDLLRQKKQNGGRRDACGRFHFSRRRARDCDGA
jgi:hypothetical protein